MKHAKRAYIRDIAKSIPISITSSISFNISITSRLSKPALFISLISLMMMTNPQPAQAGSVSGKTQATATLAKSCTVSATDINFGVLTMASGTNRTWKNGTLSVLCSKNTSYSVKMSYKTPSPSDPSNMGLITGANSGDTIQYGIFQAPVWNNPTWEYSALNATGTGATQTYTMYGEVITLSYPTPDNYSDTVTVNLTY
jgi:spore coat protein U-like protein